MHVIQHSEVGLCMWEEISRNVVKRIICLLSFILIQIMLVMEHSSFSNLIHPYVHFLEDHQLPTCLSSFSSWLP